MRLLIVRHGESTANRDHLVTGQSLSVRLTDRGREQAACAARQLHGLVGDGVVQVFSSDALRALSTAEIIAAGLPSRPEVIQTPLLREQYLGEMEGRPTSELRPLPVPEGLDISEISWSGGETIAQVHERMKRLIEWLRPQITASGTSRGPGEAAFRSNLEASETVVPADRQAVSLNVAPTGDGQAGGSVIVLVGHGDALCVLQAVLAGRDHRHVDWDRDSLRNGEVREADCGPLFADRRTRIRK